MHQLSGLDTVFLNIESPTTYGHVCGLAVFDPSTAASPVTFEDFRSLIDDRIHLLPPYRRRLIEVPLGIDQPYWIEDPHFDLSFHVRNIGLPPPGDEHQLAAQVARIVSRPLDRRRPLWEVYLIEGLEGGYIAQLSKIHHCAIDGVSGNELLANLLDLEPEPPAVDPPAQPWEPDREPSDLEMLGRGIFAIATRPIETLRVAIQTIQNLPALAGSIGIELPHPERRIGIGRQHDGDDMLSQASTHPPRTSFNAVIGPHRRFAFTSIRLADVKAVKNTFGVTVNDVVMAMCSGALRQYLSDRDELPDAPLIAMVPVSVRSADEHDYGNQVATMTASLHTHVADPIERLLAIHESMRVAKESHNALPATLLQDFARFSPPAVVARAARVTTRAAANRWMDLPYNVVISNIPGPQFPLYGVGAELVANYPISTIVDGSGLNITVQSYNGSLDVGVIGCRELVPDIWDVTDNLEAAAAELKKLARAKNKRDRRLAEKSVNLEESAS